LGDGAAVVANGNANVGLRATSDGVAIVAEGQELAIYAPGNSLLTGDLTVHGACIGCQLVAVAVNASDVSLNPGDAVTVVGTRTDEGGTLLLEVRPAVAGDRAMGIVLESAAHTTVPTGLAAEVATYRGSDGSARPGDPLRLALAGIVPSARGDASGGEIQAGDSLVPSATEGILAKAGPDVQAGGAVGYALGPLTAGQLAVLIDLH
jgi:hypothetical protein